MTGGNWTKPDKETRHRNQVKKNRDEQIRKYFQASTKVNYSNTEFSTPNASSKHLEEYEIEQSLGSGGYAEVRMATHMPTGHKVAIKIYEKYKLIDLQVKQNLIREIKILHRVSHPNIMRLFESIDTYNNVYLVTEYISGPSLHEFLKQKERVDEAEANRILLSLMEALNYLHARNISHRDIKLENIIINQEDNEIKLLDFGFAVFSTKPLKLFCGTANYMAPEILQKKEYRGSAIDVWTCGILYYTLLTGRFPFQAHTDRELTRRI